MKNEAAKKYWNQQLVYMRHLGQDEYEDLFSEFFKAGWDARKTEELHKIFNEPQPFGSVFSLGTLKGLQCKFSKFVPVNEVYFLSNSKLEILKLIDLQNAVTKLENQNEILQANLDEAVKEIEYALMGDRKLFMAWQSRRALENFLAKVKNNHDQCLSTDECQEGKETK
jgi:hypothetical protein